MIKVNLFFAVTGLRPDGYHNILSINSCLTFGDDIIIDRWHNRYDQVVCEKDTFDSENNTITHVLKLFRAATSIDHFYRIYLTKNIPTMAGFGGGSSNAAVILKFLNESNGGVLSPKEMDELTLKVGTDCVSFLHGSPIQVAGVGERAFNVPQSFKNAIKNYRIFLFKPKIEVSTPTAYEVLRSRFSNLYLKDGIAKNLLSCFRESVIQERIELPLYNTFSQIFFKGNEELKILCDKLKTIGSNAMLTGSGSGFFCLTHNSINPSDARELILDTIGKDAFFVETSFLNFSA